MVDSPFGQLSGNFGTLGSIFTFDNFLKVILYSVLIALLLFMCLLVGFMIWYIQYKINIVYLEPIGDKTLREIGKDKAKLIREKGGLYKLRLFWKFRKIEPVQPNVYVPTKKGKKLYLITDGMNFEGLKLSVNPGFQSVDMHKIFWMVQSQKEIIERYSKPSFWERYGSLIITGGTVLFCLAATVATVYYANRLYLASADKYVGALKDVGQHFVANAPGR